MHVYVDGAAFENEFGESSTVRDLVDAIRLNLSGTDRLVMDVRGDGLDLATDEYAATLDKPVTTYDRYDFVTRLPHEVIVEAMPECVRLLSNADSKRAEVVDLITQGDNPLAMKCLAECCQAWQQIQEAIRNAVALLNLEANASDIEIQPLSDILGAAQRQLSQMREALQAQDYVLVSDILQYEFDPISQGWHTALESIGEFAGRIPQNA